mmetsp:Transcript_15297/g.20912  ORF Transcript_15297/g.20912 Transcript_15297/m.20912 type:complete len:352 (-) Transcript_15297:155-1210(-)|eukprot:CAMPEP_0185724110 /NCGR_PEP_ID=MMETSP1171-20130828/691_1 /TAXON_ID=374046 /ORGANISM="Helicotheca tamensis, Strain CCMP826" /LENGTH=351 /DNA_ID=CAMNT_0028391893 /DNA_START=30 /DNA_END=1085 /DNA_ORIENTATION=+
MEFASADAAAGPALVDKQHLEGNKRLQDTHDCDVPLKLQIPTQTSNSDSDLVENSKPGGMNRAARRNSSLPPQQVNTADGGESGYYYPTGYFHPKTKPLKSCLSNSNLCSMNRVESAPVLSSMSSMRRNVSFHKVEIREYERAIGDHPCSTGGTSLSLGWNYNPDHNVVDFEPYEEERRKRTAGFIPPPVPLHERRRLLIEGADATPKELQKARHEILVVRGQRRRTNELQQKKSIEKFEERFQSAKRKMKRFISGTSKSKEEEKLWKNAEKAMQKRTTTSKTQSTEDMTQPPSEKQDNDNLGKSDDASLASSAELEVENSSSSEVLSSSFSAKETSNNDDDWEFSYIDEE